MNFASTPVKAAAIAAFLLAAMFLLIQTSAANNTVGLDAKNADLIATDNTAFNNDYILFQQPTQIPTVQPPQPSTAYDATCGQSTRLTSGAKRTIDVSNTTEAQSAINNSRPGDVIRLAAGNYTRLDIVDVVGTSADPITIEAAEGAYRKATIDGNGSGMGISTRNSSHIAIRNLEITNTTFGIFAMGLENSSINNNFIHDLKWKAIQVSQVGDQSGVTGRPSSNVDITCNTISNTGLDKSPENGHNGEGIYIGSGFVPGDRTTGIDIMYNEVSNTTGEAIELKSLVTNSRVINNKVYNVTFSHSGNIGAIVASLSREFRGITDTSADPKLEISGNRIWNIKRNSKGYNGNDQLVDWPWSVANGIRIGGPVTVKDNLVWNTQDAGIKIQDIYKKTGLFSAATLSDNIFFSTATNPVKPTGQINKNLGVLTLSESGNLEAVNIQPFMGPVTGTATGQFSEGSGFITKDSSFSHLDQDFFW